MNRLKIIADDRIPYLKGVLEPFAEIRYLPGHAITSGELKDASALLTRTRTRCDRNLLNNTGVRFIGTATIGYDHIDTHYCEEKGIVWKNAPGCNASSVNQYIASTLTTLAERFDFSLKDRVMGVVGVGHVGSLVVRTAELLGMRVYLCDPPRVRNEGICGFISLEGILRECDLISFHVPLQKEGEDRTWHMIDDRLLKKLLPDAILINTSRGEVADGAALKSAIRQKRLKHLVLDVWENEPLIDRELLDMTDIGTPHIAGYSADGKANATAIVIGELSRFFGLGLDGWKPGNLPPPENPVIEVDCTGIDTEHILSRVIKATYEVMHDDENLRKSPEDFEKIRDRYPPRREFGAYSLKLTGANALVVKTCRKLGFKVI